MGVISRGRDACLTWAQLVLRVSGLIELFGAFILSFRLFLIVIAEVVEVLLPVLGGLENLVALIVLVYSLPNCELKCFI